MITIVITHHHHRQHNHHHGQQPTKCSVIDPLADVCNIIIIASIISIKVIIVSIIIINMMVIIIAVNIIIIMQQPAKCAVIDQLADVCSSLNCSRHFLFKASW